MSNGDIEQSVRMIYLGQDIGGGTIRLGDEGTFRIKVEFEWPPDAIAIVQGRFDLQLTSDDTCAVNADFPGLLEQPIDDGDASYFTILIGARPQFNITTHAKDRLVFGTTGPFSDPEEVTGYQLGISPAEQQHPLTFDFRVVPG